MRLAIGCDQYGLAYKKDILVKFGSSHAFLDCGTDSEAPVCYPDIGVKVAQQVSSGACERGILICGTGIGRMMTANKVRGCYAAVCHDMYSTQRSILSNNANIMCIGALVVGKMTMETLVELWLALRFDPQSHSAKNVREILRIEESAYGKM